MTQTDIAVDAARADIGLVCSLPLEIGEFLSRCQRVKSYTGDSFKFFGGLYGDIRVAIVQAGTGTRRAHRATHALLDAHQPRWVISTGFAGSLRDDIQTGHIVVSSEVANDQSELLSIDLRMESDPANGLHVGKTLTVDHMVRSVSEKRELADKANAIAVDMETLAVAKVCRERSTRFMAVRAISDDLSADLPSEVYGLVGETGAVRMGAVFGTLFKRPSSLKDLWQMRGHALHAATRLANFLDGIVVQLHRAT